MHSQFPQILNTSSPTKKNNMSLNQKNNKENFNAIKSISQSKNTTVSHNYTPEKGIFLLNKINVINYQEECQVKVKKNQEWKMDGLKPMRDVNTSFDDQFPPLQENQNDYYCPSCYIVHERQHCQ